MLRYTLCFFELAQLSCLRLYSSYGQGYQLEHLRKYMDAIELDIMH